MGRLVSDSSLVYYDKAVTRKLSAQPQVVPHRVSSFDGNELLGTVNEEVNISKVGVFVSMLNCCSAVNSLIIVIRVEEF